MSTKMTRKNYDACRTISNYGDSEDCNRAQSRLTDDEAELDNKLQLGSAMKDRWRRPDTCTTA
jgi:hypothetical protein